MHIINHYLTSLSDPPASIERTRAGFPTFKLLVITSMNGTTHVIQSNKGCAEKSMHFPLKISKTANIPLELFHTTCIARTDKIVLITWQFNQWISHVESELSEFPAHSLDWAYKVNAFWRDQEICELLRVIKNSIYKKIIILFDPLKQASDGICHRLNDTDMATYCGLTANSKHIWCLNDL